MTLPEPVLLLLPWCVLPAGIVLLIRGADWLVDGAVEIARRLGFSTLCIGLTIVAFGTSAPELAVGVVAALFGHTDLSFGNAIGSNIANIGLVIGLGALVAPIDVHGRVIAKELPWLIAVSLASIGLAYGPPAALTIPGALTGGLGRTEGLLLLAVFAGFCLGWYRAARRDARDPLAVEAARQARALTTTSAARVWLLFLVGLIALVAGGKLTEAGAVSIAKQLGLSQALIGMTVVAVATSLPEIFTVLAAARKGHADLAVGNVVGSNAFNLLLVLATAAVITDIPVPTHGAQDLWMMLAMTALLLLIARTHERSVNRLEGALLLTLYVAYLSWSVVREKM